MKSKPFLLLTIIALSTSTCHREGPSCHHNIIFKNSSSDTIIYALKGSNGTGFCTLVFYSNADPNEDVILDLPIYCWEQELGNGKTAKMYIVDPGKFISGTGFYDCDSIAIKNEVLKHYKLALDDVKRNNFTITYNN